jgi:hypothetical protein
MQAMESWRYEQEVVDRLTCKRLKGYNTVPFNCQNVFQGSNCRIAGPVSHECDETIRRQLHPGSNLEHLTPVWMWSQAEPEEINDGAEA